MFTTEQVINALSKLNWEEINVHLEGEFKKYRLPEYEKLSVTKNAKLALDTYLMHDFIGAKDVEVEKWISKGNKRGLVDVLITKPNGWIKVADWKNTGKGNEEIDYLHDKEYNDLQWSHYVELTKADEVEFRFISHKDGIMAPLNINVNECWDDHAENVRIIEELIKVGKGGKYNKYNKHPNSCLVFKNACGYFYVCREKRKLGKEYDKLLDYFERYEVVKEEFSDSSLNLLQSCPWKFKLHYALEALEKDLVTLEKIGFTEKDVKTFSKDDNKEGRLGTIIHYAISYVYGKVKENL